MRHKYLFLCLIGALLLPAPASATDQDEALVQERPALEALLSLGARYRYGGDSPATGFDCSGLVMHAFQAAWGVLLPRSAREQSAVGRAVRLADLQPGDLVFYNTRHRAYSHVGIYLGAGRFIHAPRRGQHVRTESLQSPYWRARFNGARRVEPPEG